MKHLTLTSSPRVGTDPHRWCDLGPDSGCCRPGLDWASHTAIVGMLAAGERVLSGR